MQDVVKPISKQASKRKQLIKKQPISEISDDEEDDDMDLLEEMKFLAEL